MYANISQLPVNRLPQAAGYIECRGDCVRLYLDVVKTNI
jgi:hypothetical protein